MKKGFTLIEILVVLAIIGLFLAFILTSLSGGRNRATENRYKTAIATALAQAENYRSMRGTYYGACSDSLVNEPVTKVGLLGVPPGPSGPKFYCIADSDSIAFYARLISNPSMFLCVDSQGGDRVVSSTGSSVCPNSQ
jgi:prepilin-type N-terminal cleavage/methylation domain-containing protein